MLINGHLMVHQLIRLSDSQPLMSLFSLFIHATVAANFKHPINSPHLLSTLTRTYWTRELTGTPLPTPPHSYLSSGSASLHHPHLLVVPKQSANMQPGWHIVRQFGGPSWWNRLTERQTDIWTHGHAHTQTDSKAKVNVEERDNDRQSLFFFFFLWSRG